MGKAYWLGRRMVSLEMARNAAGSEARLVHYDLAGRYSLNAMSADPAGPADTAGPADAPPATLDAHRAAGEAGGTPEA